MAKRAFMVLTSGGKYQTFLPDYILFAQEAYPDDDVIILNDDKIIKPKIQKGLDLLVQKGYKFKIINVENNLLSKRAKKSSFLRMTLRWLIDNPLFYDYEEIYVGDIDLLILKEKEDLFSQHKKHSDFIKLPYSDIVRKDKIVKISAKSKIKAFLKFGFKGLPNILSTPKEVTKHEMTGLKYLRVADYYKGVKPLFTKYLSCISSLFTKNNENNYYLASFNDQQLTYDLLKEAFKNVPECSDNDGIECNNPQSFSYRPHHGIHLKLFLANRNSDTLRRIASQTVYKEYYHEFKLITQKPIWAQLSQCRNNRYKKILKNMREIMEEKS